MNNCLLSIKAERQLCGSEGGVGGGEGQKKALFVTHRSQLRSHLQTGRLRPREATPQQHRTQGSDARFPLAQVPLGDCHYQENQHSHHSPALSASLLTGIPQAGTRTPFIAQKKEARTNQGGRTEALSAKLQSQSSMAPPLVHSWGHRR